MPITNAPLRWAATAAIATSLLVVGCADDADDDGVDDGAGSDGDDDDDDDDDDTACSVTPPQAWAAPAWDANVVEALAVRAQLDALVGGDVMRGAEEGTVVIAGLEDLTAAWEGDPNLSVLANPGYAEVVQQCFAEFLDVLDAGAADLLDEDNVWTPGDAGGVWGESFRGINEGGLEVRQFIDKAGFGGALMYPYAVTLTEGDIDEATIDAIAAAWGNNATFDTGEEMLTDAAGYAFDLGFHADMAAALVDAKAFAGDASCQVERDDALVRFFGLWEQTMYARTVFYANRAESKLLGAATQSDFADVLHDLGEGLGLAAGFHGLPRPSAGPLRDAVRTITDEDIEAIMDAFGVDLGDLGASTTGRLLESLPELEAATEAAEGVVMDVYGVSPQEIMGYAMPTSG